ncbi:MAG: oxygen-dependent coproporphyrinogen oxidase [Chitinophagaceae bacterium]|jgi:coproporphyrinogen III oxidase|nr:oxygen-dependent coproporphyrinogen oxidase [Chitinophagaceae bacterium]
MEIREQFVAFIHRLQDDICAALERVDGKARFVQDEWQRPEGGGGKTRVIANGNVFEKGGVNTSVVFGEVTDVMRQQLKISGQRWFAAGISSVIHPFNPFVPTIHFNYRMFELYDEAGHTIDRWFGGGTDLTPYYLDETDARHFHQTFKAACDAVDTTFYPEFKLTCDHYFVNTHRGHERRGIGGIFYDHKRAGENYTTTTWLTLAERCGYAFMDAYLPIVEKHKQDTFTPAHKHWQEIRRGRYVEFNLVHDRGTLFGLKTNGRIESILMSLPPTVRFEYNYQPAPGSDEDKLLQACLQPVDWANFVTEEERNAWAARTNTC